MSFAVGVVLTKLIPAAQNRLASTGWQLLISGVPLAGLAFMIERAPPPLSPSNLIGSAYLSVVGTALAFVIWFNGIQRLPTAAPPLLGLAAPLTGVTVGWLVLSQSLNAAQTWFRHHDRSDGLRRNAPSTPVHGQSVVRTRQLRIRPGVQRHFRMFPISGFGH